MKTEKFLIQKVTHFKVMIQLRKIVEGVFDVEKWYDENGHPRNISRRRRVPTEQNLQAWNDAKTYEEKRDALVAIHSQK